MIAPLSVLLRSLAVAARVYHRAYKSVHEDQIGFQKYKIHDDIKKEKAGEAGQRAKEKEEKEEKNQQKWERKKEREREKEKICRRARNAFWLVGAMQRDREPVYTNFGLIYNCRAFEI